MMKRMDAYLLKLLNIGVDNNCTIIKNLINTKILNYNLVIDYAIRTNNPRVIYEIAKNIAKKEDIPRLEDAICETNNAMSIYFFAKDIKDISINKLADAIFNTKDFEYILKFILEIKSIDLNSLIRLIDTLIWINATEELKKILNKGIINDIDVSNKIKYYIQRAKSPQEQLDDCINAAKNGQLDDLQLYVPLYKKLLGNEKYNFKRRILKKGGK